MTIDEIITLEIEEIDIEAMDFLEEVQNDLGCGISSGWGSCGHTIN